MNKEVAKKIITITRDGYNQIAEEFASTRNYIWPVMEYFMKYIQKGDQILDLGCGNGRYYELFKNKDYSYTGVDISDKLLKTAIEKYQNENVSPNFVVADLTEGLPFEDNSFDIIFLFAVLNHIPSKQLRIQAFKEIFRVLKPGGKVLMTNYSLWNKNKNQKGVLKYTLKRLKMQDSEWKKIFGFSKWNLGIKDLLTEWKTTYKNEYLYYYAFTLAELKGLAKKSGLKVIEQFYMSKGERVSFKKAKNLISVFEKK